MNSLTAFISLTTKALNNLVVSAVLTSMAVIVTANAFWRYALNSPLEWGTDFNCIALMILVFFSIGYCWKIDGHIRMEIFYAKANLRLRAAMDLVSAGCGLFFWGLLFYQSFADIQSAMKLHEITDDSSVVIWPFRVMLTLGLSLFILNLLISFLVALRTLVNYRHKE